MKVLFIFLMTLLATDADAAGKHRSRQVPAEQHVLDVGGGKIAIHLRCLPSSLHPGGISHSAEHGLLILQQTASSPLLITATDAQWNPIQPQYTLALDEICQIYIFSYGPQSINPYYFGNYHTTMFWESNTGHENGVTLTPSLQAGAYTIGKKTPRAAGVKTQDVYYLENRQSSGDAWVYIVPPTYAQTIPGTFSRILRRGRVGLRARY